MYMIARLFISELYRLHQYQVACIGKLKISLGVSATHPEERYEIIYGDYNPCLRANRANHAFLEKCNTEMMVFVF